MSGPDVLKRLLGEVEAILITLRNIKVRPTINLELWWYFAKGVPTRTVHH